MLRVLTYLTRTLIYPSNGVYDSVAVSSQLRSHAYGQGLQDLVTRRILGSPPGVGIPLSGVTRKEGKARMERFGC